MAKRLWVERVLVMSGDLVAVVFASSVFYLALSFWYQSNPKRTHFSVVKTRLTVKRFFACAGPVLLVCGFMTLGLSLGWETGLPIGLGIAGLCGVATTLVAVLWPVVFVRVMAAVFCAALASAVGIVLS